MIRPLLIALAMTLLPTSANPSSFDDDCKRVIASEILPAIVNLEIGDPIIWNGWPVTTAQFEHQLEIESKAENTGEVVFAIRSGAESAEAVPLLAKIRAYGFPIVKAECFPGIP